MSETKAQIRKRRSKALAEISQSLSELQEKQPDLQTTEHLIELLVNRLSEQERISYDGPKDQFTKKPLGNDAAMADAFGISFFGEGEEEGAKVDIFVADPYFPSELTELKIEKLSRLCKKAERFVDSLKNGVLGSKISQLHPSKAAADAVIQAIEADLVREWRIWVATTSTWSDPGKKTVKVNEEQFPNAVVEVLDLDFICPPEDTGITQKFRSPGLPCIPFVGEGRGYSCYLSVITGEILAELYHKHGTALIEENVRAYLGNNKVNKQVKETIKDQPERFLAYNNGLVVSAESVKVESIDGPRILAIEQMQIINGGQTTASIYHSLFNTTKARKEEIRSNLQKLWVPMKIVVPDADLDDYEKRELRNQISRAANSQTAVKISDLAANDPFQIELFKIMESLKTPENDYWFYERARGLYQANLKKQQGSAKRRWEKEHPSSKVIDKTDVSSTWLVWNKDPMSCARGKEIAFRSFQEKFLDPKTLMPKEAYGELSEEFVKKIICQFIILRDLQKAISSARVGKDKRIQNPKVPAIYTVYLFNEKFGPYVDWDCIWSKQATQEGMLDLLQKMTWRVDSIIRQEMGTYMINMWGRRPACRDSLVRRFTYDGIEADKSIQGLKLPADFKLGTGC